MKKVTYLLLTLLIIINTATAEKWELIDNDHTVIINNKEYSLLLSKMLSVNNTIYAINFYGRYNLIKSSDKTSSWELCFNTPPPDINFEPRLYDLIHNNGNIFLPSDSGIVYSSFDEGKTWESNYLGDEYKNPIKHLKFVNDSVGFLGHIIENGFLKTTDNGKTWNPLPSVKGQLPEIFILLNFVPVDENTIYLVGRWTDGYHFYFTDNKGETWNKLNTVPFESYPLTPASYSHLVYKKPYFLVEKLYKPGSLGNTSLMKSKDFINWEPLFISDTILGGKYIHDIQYFDNTTIGLGLNIFIVSYDFGETWVDLFDENEEFYSRNNPINGFAYEDGYVYATGSILVKDNEGINRSIPRMYKYKLGLKTSIETIVSNLNIYPNPAKEEININYDKMINSIEILDLNGKRVLSNQYLAPQMEQSIKIDYLNAGTYFIRINDKVYKRFVKE